MVNLFPLAFYRKDVYFDGYKKTNNKLMYHTFLNCISTMELPSNSSKMLSNAFKILKDDMLLHVFFFSRECECRNGYRLLANGLTCIGL